MNTMSISKGSKFSAEKPVLVLKDVYLNYMQHAEGGVPKYKTKGDTLLDREYPVQVLVNKKICKAIKSLHKKLSVKEYTAEEYEETFQVAPPFVAEDYYVIRLGNNAGYKDKKTGEIKSLTPPKVVNKLREELKELKDNSHKDPNNS